MSNNLLKSLDDLDYFKNKDLDFTLSNRLLSDELDVVNYINKYFSFINLSQVETFFGFTQEFSPLYGGRGFSNVNAMNAKQVLELDANEIGLSLTLTNNYFSENDYKKSLALLNRHHKKGNSIVCENNQLAHRIKEEFPLYTLKASLIKDLNNYEKVKEALELYDYVVIPMEMNDDDDFLKSLPQKERIILFANANCAYNCSSRICYSAISKGMIGKEKPQITCSKDILPRDQLGHVFFDVKKLHSFGFTHFKLVPNIEVKKEIEQMQNTEHLIIDIIKQFKPVFYLLSFPKSGRTWLRYLLANYINSYFNLNEKINMHTMFTIVPNDSVDAKKGLNAYRYVKDERFPALIASHKALTTYDSDKKIILLRGVYDVLVSDFFQHVHFLKKFDGDIKEFIRQKSGSLYRYCQFINDLEFNRSSSLLLTYEMMHQNISTVTEEVLHYLEIDINQDILAKSIELSTFENMQTDELKSGLPGYQGDSTNLNSLRVREGKADNFTKYLNANDLNYIQVYCENNLNKFSKELLKKLNINYQKGSDANT